VPIPIGETLAPAKPLTTVGDCVIGVYKTKCSLECVIWLEYAVSTIHWVWSRLPVSLVAAMPRWATRPIEPSDSLPVSTLCLLGFLFVVMWLVAVCTVRNLDLLSVL
jgi:hypothetical protein